MPVPTPPADLVRHSLRLLPDKYIPAWIALWAEDGFTLEFPARRRRHAHGACHTPRLRTCPLARAIEALNFLTWGPCGVGKPARTPVRPGLPSSGGGQLRPGSWLLCGRREIVRG
ncbi:hypothetical protein SALBM311S_01120 [Streptomyces alboniger]